MTLVSVVAIVAGALAIIAVILMLLRKEARITNMALYILFVLSVCLFLWSIDKRSQDQQKQHIITAQEISCQRNNKLALAVDDFHTTVKKLLEQSIIRAQKRIKIDDPKIKELDKKMIIENTDLLNSLHTVKIPNCAVVVPRDINAGKFLSNTGYIVKKG